MFKLYNSLTRKIEEFVPINPPKVGMYSCGPTVYNYQHIGNYRTYTSVDLLKRLLTADGYEVNHVMNITDVGHLVSDSDEGDDKLEKGARERGMTVWETAKFFEKDFWESMDQLNIIRPNVVARATEHIKEQIKLIEKLEEKGYTYQTEQGVYFDVSKFPDYTKLSGQKLEDKNLAVREEVRVDTNKRNPQDFALWLFTVGHHKDHTMRWPSPWGEGFPGWHIECSAMSMTYLGNTLDIHVGGVEHLPVHHTNEIAQSEAATGEKFANVWVHNEHLLVNGQKMSKSLKNFYTLKDLEAKGVEPLTLRYLYLTAHYRDKLNLTWESLQAAQNAINNLRQEIRAWDQPEEVDVQYYQKFLQSANNDLNMPQALAVMWEMVRSDLPSGKKSATLLKMDQVFGLKLDEFIGKPLEIPSEVQKLIKERENARKSKDFKKADNLRHQIKKLGFEVEDTPAGPRMR